jgi:hypothetical protein
LASGVSSCYPHCSGRVRNLAGLAGPSPLHRPTKRKPKVLLTISFANLKRDAATPFDPKPEADSDEDNMVVLTVEEEAALKEVGAPKQDLDPLGAFYDKEKVHYLDFI